MEKVDELGIEDSLSIFITFYTLVIVCDDFIP